NGGSTTLSIAVTGSGPWSGTLSDGTAISGATSPLTVSVSPSTTTTYTIATLSDANCAAIAADMTGSAVVTVNPIPATPIIAVDNTNAGNYNGISILSTTAPGTLVWAPSGNFVLPGTATSNPTYVNLIGTYTVTATELGCTSAAGSALVAPIIKADPFVSLPSFTLLGVQQNAANLPQNQALVLNVTVGNGDQLNYTPNNPGNKVVVNLGQYVTLNGPLPASSYLNWTSAVVSGEVVITGTLTQSIPADYSEVAQFPVITSSTCTDNVEAQFVVSNTGANVVILDDYDMSNNTAQTQYTVHPVATITNTPETICNGESPTVNVTVNATGNWTLNLSPSGTLNGTGSGNFTIAVSPSTSTTYTIASFVAANCPLVTAQTSGSAVITVNPRPTGVLNGGGIVCASTPAATISLTINVTGTGTFNGTLTGGILFSGTGPTITVNVSPATPGVYTYSILSMSDDLCASLPGDLTGTATVTVNPRPTAVLTGTTTICNGGSTNLSIAFTGTGPWTYSINGGSPLTAATSPATVSVSPSTTTIYNITSLYDTKCSAISSDYAGSATVSVNARPTAVISGSTTICNGGSATLSLAVTGSGAISGSLSDGTLFIGTAPTITVSVSPLSTTTYTVATLVDANCSAIAADLTGSATVTVNPRPTAVISGTTTICNGGSATLSLAVTGTGTISGTLSNGAAFSGTAPTITVSVSPSGTTTYTVATLNDANCSAIAADLTGSATVTVNPRPTSVISGTTTICNGDAATLTLNFTGTAPWTYSINGAPTVTTSSNPELVSVSPTGTTTYTVTSLTDANCTALAGDMTGSAVITVNPLPAAPNVAVTQPTFCTATATLTATPAAGFEFALDLLPFQASNVFTGVATGSHTVKARLIATGCVSLPTFVTVNAQPITAGPDIALGSVANTLFTNSNLTNNIVYNVSEVGGSPAVGDTIRIPRTAGFTYGFNPSATSITDPLNPFATLTLDNVRWKLDDNPLNSFVSLILDPAPQGDGIPGTLTCLESVRVAISMTRVVPNVSTFTLSARLRRANGEAANKLVNNLNSIVFSSE
ncbi:MAG: hypothetical protein V4722_00005, partial [Bacteroidota bacterium]